MEIMLSLVQNVDIFAWSLYEVPRVDPAFIMHKLNVNPLVLPKKQRLRRSAKSHVEAMGGSGEIKTIRGYKGSVLPRMVS